MISNQPPTALPNRASETRTSLNAVFRRLSGTPTRVAPRAEPQLIETPARPAMLPADVAQQTPAAPAAPTAASALAAETTAGTPTRAATGAEPTPTPVRASLAAAVLARIAAAIAANPPSEPRARATPPSAPGGAHRPPEEPAPPAALELPQPAAPAETAKPPLADPRGDTPTPPEPPPAPEQPETIPPEGALEQARVQQPAPAAPEQPSAWPVPRWLVAPVLALAIPDSPFGWGNRAAEAPRPSPAVAPRAAEMATVGFAEPEGAATVAPELPVATPAAPIETPAEDVAEAAPEPAAAPGPVEAESLPAETLAEALRRGVADGPERGKAEAALRPLPHSAGEVRPWAQQVRAERPLGAPQAAPQTAAKTEAAPAPETAPGPLVDPVELPAGDLPPVLVEPHLNPVVAPAEAGATAVTPRAEDQTTMRNRRLYRRVALDAEFEIDGAPAQLVDLSMGGFAAAKAPALAPNVIVPVMLRLSIDGVEVSTRMRARAIYFDDLHANALRSGGRFIDLTASQTALLRYIVTWHGQSVGALGTTTLLDAITRWPEGGLPAELRLPEPAAQKTPWWSRVRGWFGARGTPDQ